MVSYADRYKNLLDNLKVIDAAANSSRSTVEDMAIDIVLF